MSAVVFKKKNLPARWPERRAASTGMFRPAESKPHPPDSGAHLGTAVSHFLLMVPHAMRLVTTAEICLQASVTPIVADIAWQSSYLP